MRDLLRLVGLFRPYTGWIALGVLASLATLAANVTLMAMSAWFIAAMAAAGLAQVSMNYFTPAAVIRACAMIRSAGRYGERLITHEATFRLISELRVWFYRRLEPLAPAVLQGYRSGDLLSRIRGDIDTLEHFYLRILVPILVAFAGIIGFTLFLLLYSPLVAGTLLLLLLSAGVLMPVWSARRGARPGRELVRERAALRAALVDGLQGLAELSSAGAAPAQAERLQSCSRQLGHRQAELNRLSALSQASLLLFANLAVWLVLVESTPLVQAGRIAPIELAMLAMFSLASFEAVMPLPGAFQALGETLEAARRVFALVDREPEVAEPERPAPLPRGRDLEFRNLGFAYPGNPEAAIQDLSLRVPEGQRLGIIGPSGSGKSTLVQLLLRFWEPQRGRILLGGQDLTKLRSEELRQQIALVSQHTHLFNTSIRENLRLANPEACEAAIEQACRHARIHDFISAQPEGYDTWAGETGVRLSGGQARRIAIARALLKDAPILILDEPTEGLDPITEQELMQTLIPLMRGRTVILVSHQLRLMRHMDRLAVLQRGRLQEAGETQLLLSRPDSLTGKMFALQTKLNEGAA
jgi:ATP-binding cassette subfamily C protein CydC